MPNYFYKAKNSNGEELSGNIEGMSESLVAEQLIKSGLFPFHIEEKEISVKKSKNKINIIVFTRQLYVMVRSGVPISKALRTLEVSSENLELSNMFKNLRINLDNGYELHVGLQKHPKIFSPFYINMVKIGELTGRLEEILSELYKFLSFEEEIKKAAKSALRYPSFVIAAMAIAFIIMMVFVIPTFSKIYAGFKADLPLPTTMLIGTSNFLIDYGLIILIGFIVSIYMFLGYIKTEIGDYWWSKFKFGLPIIGKIIKKSTLARFAKAFSLSLKSGIPIVQSLGNIQFIIENSFFEKKIEAIKESIERGNTLYNSMKTVDAFEPLVLEMISTGEEAGEIDVMCDEIALLYEEEVQYDLKNLSSYIEPVLLVGLGGLVLILALGIFLPIWDLSSAVMGKQ